ncbi:conserved Plasmodium protein, unknown function [Plasmodium gallinaceum]|uniref:Uncharacterized protein n=1 Tax=Plasmodium gallinaceum TaxID=5849 RepID=A0A1J1GMT5_PLAGA|nr:conserved Plasmodium protein, unknown function [Plasmodium gallinaceum]CRG93721.1 conserved Plasmodium protein, unknown function [Plasmodium gallinaceum]
MNNRKHINKLNNILKCDSIKQNKIRRNNIKYENINEKYLNVTNCIGKKYIEKLINECYDLVNNTSEDETTNKIKNYDGKNKNNDIEFIKLSNLEVDNILCKIKGANLHEGRAGMLNEVIMETLNKVGEYIYIENCDFEAFVKKKDEVDNLNYIKEPSEKENGYDIFINNNLYNKYLHQKHHDLINLNYNKYNINANFSNYKNIKEKKINEKNTFFDELKAYNSVSVNEQNERNENYNTKESNILNKYYDFSESNKSKKRICYNENIFSENHSKIYENNSYNETIKKCYIFPPSEYDDESIKLIKNGLKCNIRDLKNGSYVISFNIRKSGYYYLSIFYKKKPVAESPYLIHIKPSTPYATNCILYKDSNNKIIIPTPKKKKYKKKIHKNSKKEISSSKNLSNIYSNSFYSGEFNLNYSYSDNETNSELYCDTDNTYCSSISNKYPVSSDSDVNEGNRNRNSYNGINMNILKCYNEEEENNRFSNFFIQSYDAYNNKINEGKTTYEVIGLGDIKITEINDLNNGIYEVVYKYLSSNNSNNGYNNNINNSNKYREIRVTLNGFHIKGSPFRIILKNDKNAFLLNKIKNLLPIHNLNTFNPTESILNIMNSYKNIKDSYLNEENKTYYMNIYPYYEKNELDKILKKVDNNLISLMTIPMKEQIFNYIKYMNDDKELVKLKKTLYKELLVANSKMLNCAFIFNEDFEEGKQNLMKDRNLQEQTIKEITLMYKSLKEKNIHTLPFEFAIKDMKLYEQEINNKKKELLEKQNKLIERYNILKGKETKFYEDREQITKELKNKYKLHQTIYECSQDALIKNNNNLKRITISNIKRSTKNEKNLLTLKSEKSLKNMLSAAST